MGNCSVADQFCTSAANFEDCEFVRTRCYSCGQPVCKPCSLIVMYYGKKHRLCHNCISEYTQSDELIMEHLYELAGYPTKLERPIIVR